MVSNATIFQPTSSSKSRTSPNLTSIPCQPTSTESSLYRSRSIIKISFHLILMTMMKMEWDTLLKNCSNSNLKLKMIVTLCWRKLPWSRLLRKSQDCPKKSKRKKITKISDWRNISTFSSIETILWDYHQKEYSKVKSNKNKKITAKMTS
jgi:hypothetical protein